MARRRQSITMQDVADLAGVSRQTVSVVVNGRPGISPATRDRVWSAVEELGYYIDTVARSLRTGRTRTIGLIVSDTSSPFIGGLAVAVEDCARASGYSVVLYNTHDDMSRESAYFNAAASLGADGVIFISATDECPGAEALRSAGIPSVAFDRIPFPYQGPAVMLGNVKVGFLAGQHLVGLGHTRLAHISGPHWVRMSRERLAGLRQALAEGGSEASLRVETAEGWDYRSGYEAMQRLLSSGPKPTGVFAAADILAIGAMRALREAGLRVPADVSIVGVDDIDSAAYQCPPLTTIRQSVSELAELSVKLLLDILSGDGRLEDEIVMNPLLVVRDSTSAPSGTDVNSRETNVNED
jgi:LacI family transcriptional regulator